MTTNNPLSFSYATGFAYVIRMYKILITYVICIQQRPTMAACRSRSFSYRSYLLLGFATLYVIRILKVIYSCYGKLNYKDHIWFGIFLFDHGKVCRDQCWVTSRQLPLEFYIFHNTYVFVFIIQNLGIQIWVITLECQLKTKNWTIFIKIFW